MRTWLLILLADERGGTLAITRKTANTLATAAGMNTNYDEIEAVLNGGVDADNLEADGVTAVKINVDVVRSGYGLAQHTDGSLYVDAYGVIQNGGTNGVEWGRSGDVLLTSSGTVPDGFSDITATYSERYLRIGSTGLATGGSATHSHAHTHGAGSYAGPSHSHTVPASSAVWGTGSSTSGKLTTGQDGGNSATTDASTSSSGTGAVTGTSASDSTTGANTPLFVDLKMYAHD